MNRCEAEATGVSDGWPIIYLFIFINAADIT